MLTYPHEEENCHSSRSRKHHIHSERVRSLCFSKRILHLTKAALRLYAMRLNYYYFFWAVICFIAAKCGLLSLRTLVIIVCNTSAEHFFGSFFGRQIL
jgi:hypothetical protein